jgi:hypothetical protein
MSSTVTTTYSHTHSLVFLTDNLRNTLREVIRENGLNPDALMQDWATIERGIRTWLQSGHLTNVVIEFFREGATAVAARWEFPITYAGSGVEDDMWLDKSYLRQLIAKARRPTPDCRYRIVLSTKTGAPSVDGFEDCTFLSTSHLFARPAGTMIATGHMTAGVTYWR